MNIDVNETKHDGNHRWWSYTCPCGCGIIFLYFGSIDGVISNARSATSIYRKLPVIRLATPEDGASYYCSIADYNDSDQDPLKAQETDW